MGGGSGSRGRAKKKKKKKKKKKQEEDEGNKLLEPRIFSPLKIIPEKIAITAPKEEQNENELQHNMYHVMLDPLLHFQELLLLSHLQKTYDVPKQHFQEEKYSSWQRSLIGSQRLFFVKLLELLRYKLLDVQKTKISVDRVQDLLQRLDQRKVYYNEDQPRPLEELQIRLVMLIKALLL